MLKEEKVTKEVITKIRYCDSCNLEMKDEFTDRTLSYGSLDDWYNGSFYELDLCGKCNLDLMENILPSLGYKVKPFFSV